MGLEDGPPMDYRNCTNISEVGFRICPGTNCGFPSCGRNTTHFHCKACGFGTSQVATGMAHRSVCYTSSEHQPKEVVRLQSISDASRLQHETIVRTTQTYPYYTTLTQTQAAMSQPTGSQPTTSKIYTTQPNAMFNFVLPSQNTLYNTQNVYPNPNMFSPNYNSFGQLDPTWLTQPRLISSGNNIPPEILATRNTFEKAETTSSPVSHGCCARIGQLETTPLGMCSPLTAEAYKVVSKEFTNFSSKIDPQNWYCNPQVAFSAPSTQTGCRHTTSLPSCSVPPIASILLEENDMKTNAEEFINVEDLCFEGSENRSETRIQNLKQEQSVIKQTVRQPTSTNNNSTAFSSCMQVCSSAKKEDMGKGYESPKTESYCGESNSSLRDTESDDDDDDDAILEESTLSEETDIIVEETEPEFSEKNLKQQPKETAQCVVCKRKSIQSITLMEVQTDYPLTTTSHVSLFSKLNTIITAEFPEHSFVCTRCYNLINIVDSLEIKLGLAKNQLNSIFKSNVEKETATEILTQKDVKEVENKQKPYYCEICDKTYSSYSYLQDHKQIHTKSYSFYCEYCGKGYSQFKKLVDHVFVHKDSARYQCEKCGKRFVQKHIFNVHLDKHMGKYKFKCTVCQKGFMGSHVYKTHLRIHTREKPYLCQFCGRLFSVESNLLTHTKICSNDLQFNCKKCCKKFSSESLLKKHILRHKKEFTFVCVICGKGFFKQSSLNSHLTSHSNSKDYKCSQCENTYKSVSSLNQHFRMHTQVGVLKCEVCGKEFLKKNVFEDHMNIHLGRRPHECNQCSKTFSNRLQLHNHLKVHDGTVKKIACPVCGKLFVNGLKVHMVTHSGEKKHSCQVCGAKFTVGSSLNKHIKTKHGSPASSGASIVTASVF